MINHVENNLSVHIMNTIAKNTNERIDMDLRKFKEKFLEKYDQIDFNHLFTNKDFVESIEPELKEEFLQLNEIKDKARTYFTLAKNSLALLNVKADIAFLEEMDSVTAFFKCLPDYFNSEGFLNELKRGDNKLFNAEDIRLLQVHSYVWDSEFVKHNRVKPEVEEALMFFVGTQLINDIF